MVQYILLAGLIVSVFASLIMVQKKKSTSEVLLLLLVSSTSYLLFSYLLVYNGNYLKYPSLTVLGLGFPLLTGPLIYLYINYQTKPIGFQRIDLLHFIPFILCNFLFIDFYFMPFEDRVEAMRNNLVNYQIVGFLKTALLYLSGVIYITWTFLLLYAHRKRLKNEFSNPEKINFNWFLFLNIGLLLVWIVVIFFQEDRIVFSASSVHIICICFFGLKQGNVFNHKEILYTQQQPIFINNDKNDIPFKMRDTNYNDSNLEQVYFKIIDLIKKEKLFINPELKIMDLAIHLDIHPNLASKAINHVSEANFYDLVNKMRVEEFINNAKSADANKYTIIAMAFDAGFNSKATFYRNFKKITGISPSEFLNQSKIDTQK